MAPRVWTMRWARLQAEGFSYEQAQTVLALLNECKAFGSRTMAANARDQLESVYLAAPWEGPEGEKP